MPGDDPEALGVKLVAAREFAAMERPVRVVVELEQALVPLIVGREEGAGIARCG
jgi:hypothetical protein